MRIVEHRRHGHRDADGIHLSRDARDLARRLAPTLGRFDRVVASPKPRAVETAEALGGRVDAVLPDLAEMPDDRGLATGVGSARSFADYVRWTERSAVAGQYGRHLGELMRSELERLPDGSRLLMVSHGGVVEFSAAAARPHEAAGWGPPVGYLEGVRLSLEHGRWVRGEVLRT